MASFGQNMALEIRNPFFSIANTQTTSTNEEVSIAIFKVSYSLQAWHQITSVLTDHKASLVGKVTLQPNTRTLFAKQHRHFSVFLTGRNEDFEVF